MADAKTIDIAGHKFNKTEAIIIALTAGGLIFAYLAYRSSHSLSQSSGSSTSTLSGASPTEVPVAVTSGPSTGSTSLANAINGLSTSLSNYNASVAPSSTSSTPTTTTTLTNSTATLPAGMVQGPASNSSGSYAGITAPKYLSDLQSGTALYGYNQASDSYVSEGTWDPQNGTPFIQGGLTPTQQNENGLGPALYYQEPS